MKQSRRKANKLNNRGMSLVEVIISITILSIVVVPTLRAMTVAMTYNARARVRQEATLAGESIMEKFKAYSIETLKTEYHYGVEGTSADGKSCSSTAAGVYTFTETDYATASGNQTYTVTVTATPVATQSLYQLTNMDSTAVTIECSETWNEGAETDAYNDFLTNHKVNFVAYVTAQAAQIEAGSIPKVLDSPDSQDLTADTVNQIVTADNIVVDKRTLTFTISESSVVTTVSYQYHLTGVTYWLQVSSGTGSTAVDGVTGEELQADSQMVSADLNPDYTDDSADSTDGALICTKELARTESLSIAENTSVYLYYFPQYSVDDNIKIVNSITGTNGSSVNINCYLLKQKQKSVSDAWTEGKEDRYSVSVTGEGTITLYHNLNQNIGSLDDTVPSNKVTISQVFKNGSDYKGEDINQTSVSHKNQTISYDLTLTMNNGETDVVTLQSTKTEQ